MPENKIQINLTPEIAEGTYANLAIIAHSPSEFIIDFVRMTPGAKQANVKSRIILTPDNAKKLMLALQDNIAKYEQHMGKININSDAPAPTPVPMSFGGGEA